tara:strand:+ start:882 stop:1745 length:864 start_codon:yes stop_codon:yes gene_type:complete
MDINFLSSHKNPEPENSVLYLVGTPIGNLNDISLRALNILKNVSLIACEDTRHTKILMQNFHIRNHLISFNKHNSFRRIPSIIDKLKAGESVAIVSDAGLPSICDPGEDLVKAVKKNGLNVICIPGPCAALTALVSSGLPSSKFTFHGFLPKKKKEREGILMEIKNSDKTSILFESPHRLKKLLIELKEYFGCQREIQIYRELTKKFEENIGSNLEMILDFFQDKEVIGEITLVIEGENNLKNLEFDKYKLKKELKQLIEAGLSLSAASKYLAKKNKLKKSTIYDMY